MKKLTKIFIIIILILFILVLSTISTIAILTPKADKLKDEIFPESFFITNGTYIDYQESDDCSAYAIAYVLRSLGKDISGKNVYPKMKRFFGFMTVRSVKNAIKNEGYKAQSYYGNVSTLKQRIAEDKPVICYIMDNNDTHYVVAVGYDIEFIYLADSIKINENVSNSHLYNRKVSVKEFERLWKNKWYLCNNIYIVADYA